MAIMVREPESKAKASKRGASRKPKARAYAPRDTHQAGPDDEVRYLGMEGRARQGLPPRPPRQAVLEHRERTGETFIRREGFMSPEVFAEMMEILFPTKAVFCEYTGISPAQAHRYATGRQPVPRLVAVLIAAIAAQQRHGLPLPELSDVTG